MARKGKSTEEIIGFLREAEVRIAQGDTAGKICRGAGISEQTYYKWPPRADPTTEHPATAKGLDPTKPSSSNPKC
jgi:hypothetical protein